MTIPTGSGNDPFDYSQSDVVAARVSVDVPAEASQNLDAIVRKAEELKIHMEASARANGDVVAQLREMPELLASATEASGRFTEAIIISAGGSRNPNVPFSGRNDPVRGGSGQARDDLNRGEPVTPGANDIEADLDDLEQRDPRQAGNMRAQRRNAGTRPGAPARPGSGRPPRRRDASPRPPEDEDPENNGRGSPDDYGFVDTRQNRLQGTRPAAQPDNGQNDPIRQAQTYANQGNDIVNQVLQETRQGQSGLGNLRAINTGVQSASAMVERRALARHIAEGGTEESFRGAGAGGGGLGTAGRALGGAAKVAGVAGVAYTAVQASQFIGEQYQQYKNQGMVQGGGAAEGFGYEMQIRSLAMNPFINTEQARQVINGALNEGYSGKEFETVTDFMAENLKNMNLQVKDSVKLLNTNVVEGGQSILSLSDQLGTLKGLSKEGYLTNPQRQEAFGQISAAAIATGADATASGAIATQTMGLFSEDKSLAQSGIGFGNAITSNTQAQFAMIRKFGLQGVPPEQALASAIDKVGEDAVVNGMLEEFQTLIGPDLIRRAGEKDAAGNESPGAKQAIQQAQGIFGRLGWTLSINQTKEILAKMGANDFVGEGAEEQDKIKQENEKVENKTPGGLKSLLMGPDQNGTGIPSIGGLFKTAGSFLSDTVSSIAGGDANYDDTGNTWNKATRDAENSNANFVNSRVQGLVSEYGSGSIMVEKEGGGEERIDQSNEAQINAIVKGERKLRIGDSTEWQTIDQAVAEGSGEGGVGGSTNVSISLSPEAERWFRATAGGRSENQQSADSGRDNAQNNAPAVTEGKPWGGN